jgi:hypothetical protein
MSWIYGLLAKYLGPKFIKNASSSIVVFITSQLAKYLPGISPEALQKFGEGSLEIIGAALGLVIALVIDAKNSKPETPKIVKE